MSVRLLFNGFRMLIEEFAVLGCWFDGYPGQSSVTEGLYFILNAQKSGQIISSEIWAEVVKPGARINMSIAVRKTRGISDVCPACGAEQTGKMLSPRPFVSITWFVAPAVESVEKLHDALAQGFLLLTKGKGIALAQPHQARNVPSPKIAKTQADIQGYQIKGDSSSLDDEMGENDDDIKYFKRIHLFHDSIEQSSEETRPLSVPQQKTKYSEHRVWDTGIENEREAAHQFWLGLDAEDRQTLVKAEKTTILEKMKAQKKHTCDCSVCSRKRIAIEDELEPLYNSYYEEAERFSSSPTKEAVDASSSTGSDPSDDAGPDKLKGSPVEIHLTESRSNHSGQSDAKGDDENMDLYTDIAPDFSSLGIFPSVKGGLVSVADDVLKNDEKKFIEMMEQLALRQKAREKAMEDDAPSHAVQTRGFGAEESDGEDEYEDCGNEKVSVPVQVV
ncbi:hypothetical protein NUW58_g2642 [Xylaria curta]|uniref:Uncharacterized protein n=1 Tax=Xylaria curta TaxID=42375 RepID=A0ACC1PFY2_9PEZI|nr:hypothetical protein NUW58_g2642 [Xylaria curta]